MSKANQFIAAAMHDQHWHVNAWQLAECVVFDAIEPADRKKGKKLRPDIGDAGVSALQNQPANRRAQSQFGSDSSSERFAQHDDILRVKAAREQPGMRRLCVQISPL